MKTSKFLMAALTAMMVASCSNDNDLTGQLLEDPNSDASDVYASFSINVPVVAKTASTRVTDPGTAAESTVSTLHIFIYDTTSPYTPTVGEYSVAAGTLKQDATNPAKWITSKPIRTKKHDKYIFAGVNLTPEMVDYIDANGLGAFRYKEFAQDIASMTKSNGFVMFNEKYPALTFDDSLYPNEADAQANHISIKVSRVTAKAAVFKAQNMVVHGGGKMSNLKYGWRNVNKKFYFIQDQRDVTMVKDYNWDGYALTDFDKGTDSLAVNEYNTTPTAFSYVTENAFKYQAGVSNVDGASFISVRGAFTPDVIVTTTVAEPAKLADFTNTKNTASAQTFYLVRTSDDATHYFLSEDTAKKYAQVAGSNPPTTYTDGLCYYHLFVNRDAASPYAPYNVYRNQYIKININSIQAPGNPSDTFDDNKPIMPDVYIGADIEVNPWEVIEEDHDL